MEHIWRTIKNLSKFLRLHTVLVSPLYLQQLVSLRHNTAVLLYDYNVVRRGGGGRWLLGFTESRPAEAAVRLHLDSMGGGIFSLRRCSVATTEVGS